MVGENGPPMPEHWELVPRGLRSDDPIFESPQHRAWIALADAELDGLGTE